MKYYKLGPSELEKELDTDLESGLSSSQATERFRECGYNTRYRKPSFSVKSINLASFGISLLIAVVYLIFGVFKLNEGLDYIFCAIAAVVIVLVSQAVVAVMGVLADRGMYLSAVNSPDTLTVMRDGKKIKLKHTEIVYGDVVYLEKGDYIPFDGVIISSNGLVTDETDLSGGDRVSKHTGVISDDNLKLSQLFNTVFCGSYVIHGTAKVAVTDVCSRVYIVKSGKRNASTSPGSSKTVDVSTMFLTIFSLFCVIFTVICGLISADYAGIVTAVILFIALIASGSMKLYSDVVLKKSFLNLIEKKVYLKSASEIEVINNSDIVLVNHDSIFDEKFKFSGFITESMEYRSVTDIGKSNFSPFLYAAFCLDESSGVFKSCCRILKKIGIDFNELDAMCPKLVRSSKGDSGIKMCARAYDGNNMLIATGNYNFIKSICSNSVPKQVVAELNSVSTEMIAVAVKNVAVVPDELGVQVDGFTLIGVLGVNRSLLPSVSKRFSVLESCGVHPIVLFPGSLEAAKTVFGDFGDMIAYEQFGSLKNSDYKNVGIICDYTGDPSELVADISAKGLLPSYFGDKCLRDKKCVAFKSDALSSYEARDADVVLPNSFAAVYSTFVEAKKSFYLINCVFENLGLFFAFYVVCGVLFTLLFKGVLVSTLSAALMLLVVLPLLFVLKTRMKVSVDDIVAGNHGGDPLHNKNVVFGIFTAIVFLAVCCATKFICPPSVAAPFMLLTFVTYLSVSANDIIKRPIYALLGLIVPLVVAVLFMMPFSFVFGFSSFGILPAVIAIVVGVAIKVVSKFICRSVKF